MSMNGPGEMTSKANRGRPAQCFGCWRAPLTADFRQQRARSPRARSPRLGPFHLAGSHRAIRAGLGAAHLRKVNEARAAGALLEELEAASPKEGEDLFAGNIRMLRLQKGLGLGLHVAMKNDRAGLVQDAQAYSSSLVEAVRRTIDRAAGFPRASQLSPKIGGNG